MINLAVRYQPIVVELKRLRPDWVLEVGSGAEGLKLFWRGHVVGVDIGFKRFPIHKGVKASGMALPFAVNSCPVVVSCDMLEHIAPENRYQAVVQLARITRQHMLLVFPSGETSMQMYRELAKRYSRLSMPIWLSQHLEFGLPDAEQVANWLIDQGWNVSIDWYESANSHKRLMRWESHYPGKLFTYSLMRLVGPILAPRIGIPLGEPKLRVFIKAEAI